MTRSASRPLLASLALLLAPACASPTDAGRVQPGEPVTFRMTVASDAGTAYALSSVANPGDGLWWYSVAQDDGTPLRVYLSGPQTRCDDCSSGDIPIGFSCGPVPAAGVTATWDGIAWGAQSTCTTGGGSITCYPPSRVAPGHYRVTMCAFHSAAACGAMSRTDPVCVTVPFDYPSSSEVVGTVSL